MARRPGWRSSTSSGRSTGSSAEKATADEAEDLGEWLVAVAQEAADAAKEGGFMGFHAVRVSEGEQRMLDQLRQVLGTSSS